MICKVDSLKKFTNRYDASKVFKKGKHIFLYFSAKDINDNTFIYYLFNPDFTFDKNFELLMKKFQDIKGYWTLYTDNQNYPPKEQPKDNFLQLELF